MTQIKTWVEGNFAIILLLGAVLGFFVPSFGRFAEGLVIVLTAVLIFFACANIKFKDLFFVDVFLVALFTFLRFAIFPLVLFYAARAVFPEFSEGILLLALMPAGVAVTALCAMSGGNAALGLSLTIISSLLAPALIPGVFSFLGHNASVDIWGLFATLVLVVFLPVVIYFGGVRRVKPLKNWITDYSKILSVLILSAILVVVVATKKDDFLSQLDILYVGMAVMSGFFALCYIFGIVFSLWVPKDHRISYIYASGAMNNSLAVGIAFVYFNTQTVLFVVLSEIVFSFYIAAAQWWFTRNLKES